MTGKQLLPGFEKIGMMSLVVPAVPLTVLPAVAPAANILPDIPQRTTKLPLAIGSKPRSLDRSAPVPKPHRTIAPEKLPPALVLIVMSHLQKIM
jgi:hypothetical protein